MFDVFYTGPKPSLFAFEKPAKDLADANSQTKTEFFWFINGNNDYSNFDFTWHPAPWDYQYLHVFPSQWHANGEVYFAKKDSIDINKLKFYTFQQVKRKVNMDNWEIPENINSSNFDYSWHPNPLEDAYEYRFPTQHQRSGGPIYKGTAGIKYVTAQKVKANVKQIFYVDFMNPESQQQLQQLQALYPNIKKTRYVDNHLNVLKRVVNSATTEFVWVISSICNYLDGGFDFTWHPDESQREMIHCFASNSQKRGDTFFIHVESFRKQMYDLELLDWFNIINYIKTSVPRYDWPVHNYTGDNLIDEIKNYKFTTPYAVFTNQQDCYPHFNPCLWSEKDRVVESFTNSKAICAVPRNAKSYIKTQVYDYPHLGNDKWARVYFAEQPLDIVYISNGEPNEEEYYRWLSYNTRANFHPGKIHWVRGVNGRDAAYKSAAEASTTPWFFAVFAKLRVDTGFDFKWQPDYWQEPKHYIFHAKNPLNGLEYGHQAMIAYNKQLVLNTTETGLDFTLSAPHEVVPILSGVAEFNQDHWMTWRTAFREVLKLKKFNDTAPTVENTYRLKKWLNVANGEYAEWCLRGAADAVEYYESVNGDFDKLKLSYEWAWLRDYFNRKTL